MARYDVYRVDGTLLVDCQADAWSDLSTRLVVPLAPIEDVAPIDRRLNPVFVIDGRSVILLPNLIATIMRRQLREPITSLADDDLAVLGAIDRLLVGY